MCRPQVGAGGKPVYQLDGHRALGKTGVFWIGWHSWQEQPGGQKAAEKRAASLLSCGDGAQAAARVLEGIY